ncbi:MAG: tRNA (adenosine(37)-N6)-threonylcarbamoyltransferase complex dimerization subunit type 1 TsaB [Candidatus Omnitrophica bacterium]|nr:tRNA (adenosine(37)-N6)-threonylcarbamoyltransferase complex dimerization subunit type 1 TsaB [Candidatus Omnitrophota bacterium]
MTFFLLETSSSHYSMAIADEHDVLVQQDVRLTKLIASSLVPHIKGLFHKVGKAFKDIDAYGVGIGPGSFTSLRVGLSTLKGMHCAHPKPVIGIPSLDILAGKVPGEQKMICPLIDAKRQMVYGALYGRKQDQLIRHSGYVLCPVRELLSKVSSEVVFIGDGAELYQQDIHLWSQEKSIGFEICRENDQNVHPTAKDMFPIFLKKWQHQDFDDAEKLLPMYLYKEDCQVSPKVQPSKENNEKP